MIAWDTETRSFKWWENPAFLGTWDTGEGGQLAVLPPHGEARNYDEFRRAVRADRHHVGANLKFDAHMARENLGEEVVFLPGNKWDDEVIKSRLVYGQRRIGRHGLKELAEDFIDPEAQASEAAMQARHKELTGRSQMNEDDAFYRVWQAFPEEVETYARKDAEYTRALEVDHLDDELNADPKIHRLYDKVEMPVMEVIYRAEERGVHVDPEAVARLQVIYKAADENARRDLEATLGFVPEGDGSKEALRDGLLAAGVELSERTETGELAVNKHALEKHAEHPAVKALFEFRRTDKFLSTYLDPLADKDHIHPTFNQAEAWTGRMSGSNPNMQNLPKRTEVAKPTDEKIRSVFVPEPGMEFLIGDFESIEVFLLAYFVGTQEYKDLVRSGDPHAHTAAVIWPQFGDWTYFQKTTPLRWLRDVAKQVTYTIVYGGGGKVIAGTINKYMMDAGRYDLMVDEDQARAIRRKITENIPGFKDLTDTPWKGRQFPSGRIHKQLSSSLIEERLKSDELRKYGYVRTLMGRKQWIQMWPEEKAYVGLSGLIQGSAADIMKVAAINVFEALKPHGGLPLLFVHDEIVAQVPLGEGEHLKPLFIEAMAAAGDIDPAISVEANVTARSYAHTD